MKKRGLMLSKTHMAAGAASSLLIVHPTTPKGVIVCAAGGIIGASLCDIDCNKSERMQKLLPDLLFSAALLLLLYFFDSILQTHIFSKVLTSWNSRATLGLLLFFGTCAFGFFFTGHRSFMHSILAGILLYIGAHLFFPVLALPLAIGFGSHIVLDLLNKKGIQLFYPLPFHFCLNWCSADGAANFWIGQISFLLSIAFGGYLLFDSSKLITLLKAYNYSRWFGMLSEMQVYFVFINLAAFIFEMIYCSMPKSFRKPLIKKLLSYIALLFMLAGGPIGLAAGTLLFSKKGTKPKNSFYMQVILMSVFWICLYIKVSPD
jgi:inner membrane protein